MPHPPLIHPCVDRRTYKGMSVTVWGNNRRPAPAIVDYYRELQDFPHPADFFEPNLSKKALASSPTFNLAFASNPIVDRGLAKLNPVADPATVADEWAAMDRAVIENADVAVYGNHLATSFFSERMDARNCSGAHSVYENDWSPFFLT